MGYIHNPKLLFLLGAVALIQRFNLAKNLNNKTILCVTVSKNWGGGEQFILDLCSNIRDYDFFIAAPEGKAFNSFDNIGFDVIKINSLKKVYKTSGKWNFNSYLKILFYLSLSTLNLIKIIIYTKPCLIIANGNLAGLYSLPASIILNKKLLVIQHLIYTNKSVEAKILNILKKKVERFVAVSNTVAENIKSIIQNESKVELIYNGIKINENNSISFNVSGTMKLGMVGSLLRIKGIDLVIKSFSEINPKNNLLLNIFGSAADDLDSINYENELKLLVNRLGLNDYVLFQGHEDSRAKIYSEIDIAIIYSLIPEAFSYSVAEAMGYGKIVIATGLGGPKEIISDSYNGFLVEPDKPKMLKEKIKYCIENFTSEELIQIRRNAKKTIEEKFSIEIFKKQYEELFNSLLCKK